MQNVFIPSSIARLLCGQPPVVQRIDVYKVDQSAVAAYQGPQRSMESSRRAPRLDAALKPRIASGGCSMHSL
jgi:hypothetical protein